PEVAALHRVVKQPIDTVAIVLIVLGRIDPTLRRDAMRSPRAVLKAEALDVVSELGQRRRSRSTRQAGAHHDDRVLALVGWIYQLHFELAPVPGRFDRPGGQLRV